MAQSVRAPKQQGEEKDSEGFDFYEAENSPTVIGRDQARQMEEHLALQPHEKVYDKSGTEESNPNPRHKTAPSKNDLAQQEAIGDDSGGSFYKPSAGRGSVSQHEGQVGSGFKALDQKAKSIQGLVLGHKKAAVGSLTGLGIGGIFALFSIFSGPLQFIHIAQLMQQFHFSHQSDAGDDRMGRMYRFVRTSDIGETRLSFLESKYKNRILADLSDKGLVAVYDSRTGYFKSFVIDASNPNSPYHGKTNEEVRATLEEKYGAKVNVDQISGLEGGKFRVQADGFFKDPKTNKLMVKELGYSKVTTAIRARTLGKYGMATWHPMKTLDKRINQKASDLYDQWKKSRQARLKNGVPEAAKIDPATGQNENKDAKGKPVDTPLTPADEAAAANAPKDPNSKSTLKSLSEGKTAGLAGGVAAVAGIVCGLRAVDNHIDEIRYIQVVLPLARVGMDAVIVGNQMMSGQDVDPQEVSFLAKNFNGVDETTGQQTSWSDSASINGNHGGSGGIDIDQGTKDALSGKKIAWLHWTESPLLGGVCSGIGQAITGAVSIGLGIVSGGIATTVSGVIVSAKLAPVAINWAGDALAGNAVDVLATGAKWGNYVDYGARIAANTVALGMGGIALTASQVAELNTEQQAQSTQEFQSHNIAYRLFNPYDERSVVAKVIDHSSPSPSQNISKMASVFLNFGHVFSSFSSIFTGRAHAVSPTPYDYGFPEYGFSQEDLDNPLVANPYQNAEAAAKILDANPGYITKAHDCFGVNISKSANDDNRPRWDVVPAGGTLDPYSSTYPKNCADPGNTDWLRVRFFIMDTGQMEGYACYQGDATSCTSAGVDAAVAASTTTNTNSQSSSATSSTYQSPFRDVPDLAIKRIDQGVDYGGTGPVYALGNGKVVTVSTTSKWPGGTFINYQLSDGPAAGKYVFVAEDCLPKVTSGQLVNTNTILCDMFGGSSSIETGWAAPPSSGTIAAAYYDYQDRPDGDATAYGKNFSDFMKSFGGPPGDITKSTSTNLLGVLPAGWPTWQ